MFRMLIINPGSTSTKIAIYDDLNSVFNQTLRHSSEEISSYQTIYDQYEFRKSIILESLMLENIPLSSLDAVIGRGGLLKPIQGGTYKVNNIMLEDLKTGIQGQHASNLGGILAYEIAAPLGIPSFIVDPVVIDELEDIARISGLKEIQRKSIFHALNQKAVARRYANEIGKSYEELNLIVAHMGGGISVGAHKYGRVIDVNNALNGDGPFSPERSGSLPAGELIKMCFSGNFDQSQINKKICGCGGFVSYLGTNDARDVENMIKSGNKEAELIFSSMAYQVGKEIAMLSAVLKGNVDAIILTGGLAYGEGFVNLIREMVSFIAPVAVFPGEDEMLALAEGGLRVLTGKENAKEYK